MQSVYEARILEMSFPVGAGVMHANLGDCFGVGVGGVRWCCITGHSFLSNGH